MKTRMNLRFLMVCLMAALGFSCIEEFDAETQVFDDVLVIDARLTDEFKRHQVLLSRTQPLEQDTIRAEINASIRIIEDSNTIYEFEEIETGKYRSVNEFSAKSSSTYQLQIVTSNGKSYLSTEVVAPEKIAIDTIYAERGFNDFEEEGVSIFVDSQSNATSISYFRYEYEETYKIIAPFWNPFDFDIIDDQSFGQDGDNFEVGIKPKEREERICFNSIKSTDIIQASTDGLSANRLGKHLLRFLNRNNYIISHRYSILVKQLVQNQEAFSYYRNLDDFTSSESIFSDIQPGFLSGNIFSESNGDEKVLGYFEVTAVASKRFYFNYEDLFPSEPLPPYYISCELVLEPLLWEPTADTHSFDGMARSPLIEAIRAGLIKYHADNPDYEETFGLNDRGPYFAKTTACGDCNELGSNVKPNFWTE